MSSILNWINNNKQWLFSGIGVAALLGIVGIVQRLRGSRNVPSVDRPDDPPQVREDIPPDWNGMIPPDSQYRFVTKQTKFIPGGLQTYAFEYGPRGHVHALTLSDAIARAEIQFTCRITHPIKAMFGANEYAMNVLPPRFLSKARLTLEKYSFDMLRSARDEVAHDILTDARPMFQELGVGLETVTIGAVERVASRRPD